MSSADLFKAPAWQGLTPGLPQTIDLPPADARRILDLAGLSGRLTGLRLGGGDVAHYRVQPPAGAALFLKLVEPAQRESTERAETIAGWLAARGLPVVAPIDGYPRLLADGRLVVVTSFIDGRRMRTDAPDLAALGASVAHLHRALAVYPDQPAWARTTRMRMDELKRVRADLAAGRLICGPQPDRLRSLTADAAIEFDPGELQSAPLHGDLNPGNVLMQPESGYPVLLDFEDVFHSLLPPIFELLLMVERFVLVQINNDEEAAGLCRTLVNAYCDASGHALALSGRSASDLLRALALRSLCVLALGERSGIPMANVEWQKFFELDSHAQRRTALINRIFKDAVH